MKHCPRCGEDKDESEFGHSNSTNDGLCCWCKPCAYASSRAYFETPRGIYSQLKTRQRYHKKHRMDRYKPLTFTSKEFVDWYNTQPKICGYCGIAEEDLFLLEVYHTRNIKRLTIDCMDNDKGYVKDNIVLACHRCNMTKGNVFTYEDFRDIAQKYIKPQWVREKLRVINENE